MSKRFVQVNVDKQLERFREQYGSKAIFFHWKANSNILLNVQEIFKVRVSNIPFIVLRPSSTDIVFILEEVGMYW